MRLSLCLLAFSLIGCGDKHYRVIKGPASLLISATPWTPGINIDIEDGGRAFFGPDYDEFYTEEIVEGGGTEHETAATGEPVEDPVVVTDEPEEPE